MLLRKQTQQQHGHMQWTEGFMARRLTAWTSSVNYANGGGQ